MAALIFDKNLVLKIISYCDYADVIRYRRVCKYFAQQIQDCKKCEYLHKKCKNCATSTKNMFWDRFLLTRNCNMDLVNHFMNSLVEPQTTISIPIILKMIKKEEYRFLSILFDDPSKEDVSIFNDVYISAILEFFDLIIREASGKMAIHLGNVKMDFINETYMEIVAVDCERIKTITNPHEVVQSRAVDQNCNLIQYIKNPAEEVQEDAIARDPFVIRLIKNPKEKIKLWAVEVNGLSIQYIKNPSKAVQFKAVDENAFSIQYIKNPSEELQLVAVRQEGYSIEYIENPSENVQLAAVREDGYSIKYIKNPSERVQLAAIKQNKECICCIKNPTKRVRTKEMEI